LQAFSLSFWTGEDSCNKLDESEFVYDFSPFIFI
jgi:hypothetical protein